MVFTSFQIYKTFRAFIITFLKLKENQQMFNTPALSWTIFLSHKDLNLSDEVKLWLQLSEIFTIWGGYLTNTEVFMALD